MTDQCNVLMVYPRFNANSFWNCAKTCEVVGAKYPAAPLGLITVASMLPETWTVKLVDRNTEELEAGDFAWADLVMIGGMFPQQWDALRCIDLAHAHGKPVCIGGPGITSQPHIYTAADFRVIGESEGLLHRFIEDWRAGKRSGTYEGEKFKADVTRAARPRWDLLKLQNYLYVCVQFSRGCPFTCEFCDIIELYGRAPRTKTSAQMLAELDALYALGHRGNVDFVDDNLIGNKRAIKAFLPDLIEWQQRHDYPFLLSTEASINLADDCELLGMMRDANFYAVFIGIESPDTDTLVGMRKKQNTKRDLVASIRSIYNAGILVMGGFIVGFDSEPGSVAAPIAGLIRESAIPIAMVGLLYALPNTQLTRRLTKEGRLFDYATALDDPEAHGDQCTGGLNYLTARPRRDMLADYRAIVAEVYAAEHFFARLRDVGLSLYRPRRPLSARIPGGWRGIRRGLRLLAHITFSRPDMRAEFWKTFVVIARRRPAALASVVSVAALYVHFGPFSRYVVGRIDQEIAKIDAGAWSPPPLATAATVELVA